MAQNDLLCHKWMYFEKTKHVRCQTPRALPEVHAKPAAEHTGILGFFDCVYYDEPKTTPDVFLRAVRDLGTTVADTIVIDDNATIRPVAEAAGFTTRSAL